MKRNPHGGETAENIKYDFSVNLNPLGMPAPAANALLGDRDCFEKYPDTDSRRLRAKIAESLGMPDSQTDRIVCGAGAADIIYRLPRALDIKKAALAVPSFTEYERALDQAGVEIEYIETQSENSFALTDEFRKCPADCDAIFIANPVNPSGKLMDPADYRALLEWCAETGTTLVTDECFMDFVEKDKRAALEEASRSAADADVIAVRSFTKIFSMAGLRCGYAVFDDAEKARRVEEMGPPWSVPGPAMEAASAALDDPAFIDRTVELVSAERQRVAEGLRSCGLEVFDSDVNYILFKGPEYFGRMMLKYGAAVRDCSDYRGFEPTGGMRYYRTAILGRRADDFLLHKSAAIMGIEPAPSKLKTPSLMIQGTMSNAGKSIIAAGLCRVFRQDGLHPAPFKSQNMALNSFVTKDGSEIGRAQAVQAEACGIPPRSDMNPVLLKPSSDMGSQVIVNGKPRFNMGAVDYFSYRKQLKGDVQAAYDRLAEKYDVIVIEGAGSPAEINLTRDGDDFVNMGLAEMTDSPVILVGDIDRGGVFAQLAGTIALLNSRERKRVKGVIANKFRGDISLFDEGRKMLEKVCGVPVLGVVPYGDFDIDDEDSLSERLSGGVSHVRGADGRGGASGEQEAEPEGPLICVVRLPRISNFSDFTALEADGARLVYAGTPEELEGADAVIIPGTKSTISDMRWMRETGMAEAVRQAAVRGAVVAGICGGYQMLGVKISDPEGAESDVPEIEGLGLLPVETEFIADKVTRQTQAVTGEFSGKLAGLSGRELEGYEIHMGRSRFVNMDEFGGLTGQKAGGSLYTPSPFSVLPDGRKEGCLLGNVFGTYIHGLFDSRDFRQAFLDTLPGRTNGAFDYRAYREEQYDKLADLLRQSLDMEKIYEIMGMKEPQLDVSSADREEEK